MPIVQFPLPSVKFRLSQSQRQAIRPGLVRILVAGQRELKGLSPNPCIPILFPPPRHGMFWPLFAQLVSGLWLQFSSKSGRCRAKANFIEVSVLALATRASQKFVPDGTRNITSVRHRVVRNQLLKKLRLVRKRAARLAKDELGEQQFRELMKRWAMFARWLRFWALSTRHTDPVHKFARERRRRVLDTSVRAAKEQLAARGVVLPPDSELRSVVRQAIRQVRRHRTGFGIRTLVDQPRGHDYLVRFISKHLNLAPSSSRPVAEGSGDLAKKTMQPLKEQYYVQSK